MRKGYFLGTCSTCIRILNSLPEGHGIDLQDIKKDAITEEQLSEMQALAGSYESLFSRRSMKYKAWDLKNKELNEADYMKYILQEYTFLKRPVFIIDQEIFIGNSKSEVEKLISRLNEG